MLKWQGNIRQWEAEIGLPRRDNRKARRNPVNTDRRDKPLPKLAVAQALL